MLLSKLDTKRRNNLIWIFDSTILSYKYNEISLFEFEIIILSNFLGELNVKFHLEIEIKLIG